MWIIPFGWMRLISELGAPSDMMRSLATLTPGVNMFLLLLTKIGLGGWMNDSSPIEVTTRSLDEFRGTMAVADTLISDYGS